LTMLKSGSDLQIYWTLPGDPSLVDYYEVLRSPDPAGPFTARVGTASGNLDGLRVDLNAEPANAFYTVRGVKAGCAGPP
jgi:hypothetical protein